MDRNANVNRERRGHQVAFGDETDDLDAQPVGRRLSQPQGEMEGKSAHGEEDTARSPHEEGGSPKQATNR